MSEVPDPASLSSSPPTTPNSPKPHPTRSNSPKPHQAPRRTRPEITPIADSSRIALLRAGRDRPTRESPEWTNENDSWATLGPRESEKWAQMTRFHKNQRETSEGP